MSSKIILSENQIQDIIRLYTQDKETSKEIGEKYNYTNATIYLERKYQKAMFFKNNCRSAKELAELLLTQNGES